ncbi:MAG: hypothetical protein ABIG91_01475 [Patescibacteria group bacterium]
MIKISQRQKQILYGIILGDGYLQKTGEKNARLRLEHGQKQKEYLFWKVNQFKKLFQGKPVYLERIHPKTKKKYGYWRYQSQSTPYLGKLRKIFYPEDKKKIPRNLSDHLSSQTLAVWYMDDGYFSQRDNSSYLYLGRVSQKEAEDVSRAILDSFNLPNTILDKKIKGYVIYFSPKIVIKLKRLIKKYMISQFDYKLPLDPVTTDSLAQAKR